jgi:toxin FitB
MKFLVDTNILSELRKSDRQNRGVSHWYSSVNDDDLYLSVLVLGEIRKGIDRLMVRDPIQATILDRWLEQVTLSFGARALPVDGPIAKEWGRLNAIRPISSIDGLMAATAKIHGLTFVTRNEADIAGLGVHVLNPFT